MSGCLGLPMKKIGITLASDLNKATAQAYGVLLPDLIGLGSVSARAAFVVDKNGVIQYSEQTPTVKDLPNFAAIKQALSKPLEWCRNCFSSN
jgi:peroxiredoxin